MLQARPSRAPLLRPVARLAALAVALLVPPLAPPAAAQPTPDKAKRFAPVGELAGACWSSPMPGDARDVHCYEWTLDGAFLRDRHRVSGPQGDYAGEAIYGWDAERGVLRFWYFNTLGGVSEGEARESEEGWTFTETYRGDGAVLEFRTTQTRPTPDSYERVTAALRDGAWQAAPALRFTRTPAPPDLGDPCAESRGQAPGPAPGRP